MERFIKVLAGVLIARRVAAAHVPAGQTRPQVHPGVPHLQAVVAALNIIAIGDDLDLVNVRTRFDNCRHELAPLVRSLRGKANHNVGAVAKRLVL